MNQHDCTGCGGCPTNRRAFLRTSGAAAAFTMLFGLTHARARPHDAPVRYPIPAEDGALIDRDHEIIILRQQHQAWAFALSCPHQRTMLKWLPEQNRFQCPKHKSRYQPDGTFISGRATRGLDRHPIRVERGELIVDRAVLYRDDREPAAWKAAVARLS